MTGVVTAWLVEVVVITYRASQKGQSQGTAQVSLPMPSVYASTFLVFGVLGLLPAGASTFASVAAWGLVLATFLNLWAPLSQGQTHPNVAQTGAKTAAGNTAA
jgi:protein-S-isoprenylcysteine O-methyltransferase Ste14